MGRQPDRSCKRPRGRSIAAPAAAVGGKATAAAQTLRNHRARQPDSRVRAGRYQFQKDAFRIQLERALFSFEDERAARMRSMARLERAPCLLEDERQARIRSEEQAQALREQLEESRQQLERSRSETEAERRARIRSEGELWDIKDRLRESPDYFKRRALFP